MPRLYAPDTFERPLHAQVGICSGQDVHAALCALSAQGALFYSDCMGVATPSGVKQVNNTHTSTLLIS